MNCLMNCYGGSRVVKGTSDWTMLQMPAYVDVQQVQLQQCFKNILIMI